MARHTRLIELYHRIQALAANQVRVTDIAEQLHICRPTVYRYLQMEHPPELPSPQDRRSLPLDRYKPYLLQRWNQGIRNSQQLWREVVAQGYSQSSAPVQRFVGALRQQTGQPHKFTQAGTASLYASCGSVPAALDAPSSRAKARVRRSRRGVAGLRPI